MSDAKPDFHNDGRSFSLGKVSYFRMPIGEAIELRERSNRLTEAEIIIEKLQKVVEGYQQWEAEWILEEKQWNDSQGDGSFGGLTEDLYDKLIALQDSRNESLRHAAVFISWKGATT